MGTTPLYDLPYPEATDPADVPTDMEELADLLDTIINGIDSRLATVESTATTRPPVVDAPAALPAAVTGQEIYYRPDPAGNPHVFWHLRYNGASASAYKWEAVGAQLALSMIDQPSRAIAGSNIFTQGPAVTVQVAVPLAGEYACEASGDLGSATAGTGILCKAAAAAGGAVDDYAGANYTGRICNVRSFTPALVMAAPGNVLWVYRQTAGEAGSLVRRQLVVRPVRVTG